MSRGVPDLSRSAIAARQRSRAAGRTSAGPTGAELLRNAAGLQQRADQLRSTADRRPPGRRRDAAIVKSKSALLTAATQIRLVQVLKPTQHVHHHTTIQQQQAAEAEARAAVADDTPHSWGVLAVDTYRRVAEQRQRHREDA